MRRFWVHALLAFSCFHLSGCGGSNDTQTADNSSASSSSSSDSSRPKRGGGASDSGSNSESGGESQNSGRQSESSKRSPSMSGGDGGAMSGDPRMNQKAKDKGPQKPNNVTQEEWDRLSPGAKKRRTQMGAGGGSGSAGGSGSGGGQMNGDPRMNGGGSGEDNAAGGQMTGDPRMNGGGSGEDNAAGGQMTGDPRMNGGGGSASMAPGGEMSGDPRMNGGGGGGSGSSMAPGGDSGGGSFGGNSSGQAAAPKKPVTLKDKGIAALQDGDDDGGFQYLHGHFIAEDVGRKNIPLQFLSSIKRPRTEIRWGVGVVYTKGKGFEGDPPKIGEEPNVTNSGSNRGGSGRRPGGAGGGRRPSSGGSGRSPSSGGSGSPGGGAGAGAGGAGTPDSGGGSPGSGGAGAGAGTPGGGAGFGGGFGGGASGGSRNRRVDTGNPADGGVSELRYYAGDIGDELITWIEKVRKNGNNGSLLATIDANGPGASGNTASSGSSSSGMMLTRKSSKKKKAAPVDESASSKLKNLAPGLIMLGTSGKRDGLLGRAKAHAVDLLVVIEVRTKFVPTTGLKINDTKFTLYDVTSGEMVRLGASSSPLNNNKVWAMKEKSDDKDPVREAVSRAFQVASIRVGDRKEKLTIGQYSKLAPLPNLDQGIVLKRLASLETESLASGNPLRGLVELTYYRQKGWLPERAYTDSVNKITESKIGETLLNGSEKERVEALAPFLPPQWKVPEPASNGDANSGDFL